jgi:hypothetical protein
LTILVGTGEAVPSPFALDPFVLDPFVLDHGVYEIIFPKNGTQLARP